MITKILEKKLTGEVVEDHLHQKLPSELVEKSILGHLDKEKFEDIYNGSKWNKLREAHEQKKFDEIDYCKNCDFLYNDPEVLVWSNDPEAKVNHMLGTKEDFILTNYSK